MSSMRRVLTGWLVLVGLVVSGCGGSSTSSATGASLAATATPQVAAPTPCPIAPLPGGSASGAFTPTGSVTVARNGHTATLLFDCRVLITGGLLSHDALASAELYDPQTGTFSATGPMAAYRENHTATRLSDGRVLVVGGYSGSATLATAELYDPSTGTFSPTGSLATSRDLHTATLLSGDRVLIAGGISVVSPPIGDSVLTAELYDPGTGTFSPLGSIATARAEHTATLLRSERVLLAGGADDASAELYDPQTNSWASAGQMTAVRGRGTATLLPDGRVLFVGGYDKGGHSGHDLASAEVYDAASGFIATGSMIQARSGHTATLLPDGRVLIAGGWDGTGQVATAELYQP
jgi:hypothetical protein